MGTKMTHASILSVDTPGDHRGQGRAPLETTLVDQPVHTRRVRSKESRLRPASSRSKFATPEMAHSMEPTFLWHVHMISSLAASKVTAPELRSPSQELQ